MWTNKHRKTETKKLQDSAFCFETGYKSIKTVSQDMCTTRYKLIIYVNQLDQDIIVSCNYYAMQNPSHCKRYDFTLEDMRLKFQAPALPWKTKGFGTSLAMFGDHMLHADLTHDPKQLMPLKMLLVDMFSCLTRSENPMNISILGIFKCITYF